MSKNLKEIEFINNSNDTSITENYQRERIKKLLEYSIKNIPFYKDVKNLEISSFPIINKIDFKKNINNFCSTKFDKSKLYKSVTSGSTGTPFVSFQDIKKKQRNTADVLYFSKLAGYKFGEPLFYLKIWSSNNKKSRVVQFMQNIIPVDVIKLSKNRIKKLLEEINSNNCRVHINGYSSALEEVCKYLDVNASKKRIKVESILAQSEALTNETKERLFLYFDCLPCSRYSNLENGIIAQQTLKENTIFKINKASYFIEILKMDKDVPAENGELGRIILTDYFNYAMPFIRYDTGDIGKFLVKKNGKINFNYLEELQGRKLDLLLDIDGNIVSSYIMYKNMFKYPEIDQYQLIQEDKKDYKFIISIKGNFEKENELKREFLEYLGLDANFKIEYVDEIPLLSSGKRRKIVNNYLK